jgi:hypothetical protein
MAETYQVGIPDDMRELIIRETDKLIPEGMSVPVNRRIRYLAARALNMDSGRAYAMLMGNLPTGYHAHKSRRNTAA